MGKPTFSYNQKKNKQQKMVTFKNDKLICSFEMIPRTTLFYNRVPFIRKEKRKYVDIPSKSIKSDWCKKIFRYTTFYPLCDIITLWMKKKSFLFSKINMFYEGIVIFVISITYAIYTNILPMYQTELSITDI